ncbi:MAG: methylaspartate mutase subunit E [Chloroflexi bacterium]|nr:methylaspartate mutase subunit E [Chloroflexota bacterium]
MELSNRKWSEEELFERRKAVLERWPTGKEVDLAEAIEFHRQLPEAKVFARRLASGKKLGRILINPACGHATVEETLEHVKFLEANGADSVAVMADTYTRKSRFKEAQAGLEASIKAGRSLLNGYPWVNHGVKLSRYLVESTGLPVQGWGFTDEEPMLAAEIGFASGCTRTSSMDVHEAFQHSKNYPVAQRIQNNQYTNRLAAYYSEHGSPVDIWCCVNLNGYFPPSLGAALVVLCCLLTAGQGIKNLSYGQAVQCHQVQDVATMQVLRKLVKEYLHGSGHDDVSLSLGSSSWFGAWPADEQECCALAAWIAAINALGGADWVLIKSIEEAVGITTKEGNGKTIRITRRIFEALKNQRVPEGGELTEEREMIELETRAIVDRVIELGDGDVAVGELRAVERGVLDAPFTPWIHAARKVLPVRDRTGAMRYLDHGNLPFTREIIDYHRRKIAEREKVEGRKAGIQMLIEDVTSLSRPLGTEAPLE